MGQKRRKMAESLPEDVAYEQTSKKDRDSQLAILYDEVNVLLFQKSPKKVLVKKVG